MRASGAHAQARTTQSTARQERKAGAFIERGGGSSYPAAMSAEFELAAAAFGDRGALLGLDLGEKTIGVASCNPSRRVATPVLTIRRTKFTADSAVLAGLAAERGVVGVIVGLPRNMDGSEGPRAQASRAFARNLTRALSLPVALWDERLSTAAMEKRLIAIDTSRAKRALKIDESAAAFSMQGAIDRLRVLGERDNGTG